VARIPVAALGIVLYLGLLASAVSRGRASSAAGAVLALGGALFSAYLLLVQLVVIDAVCQWCVVNDAIVSAAVVVTVLRLRRTVDLSPAGSGP
jgi:uncharacterized membrane protein